MIAAPPASVAADLLAGFPAALREAGLAIDTGRTQAFLRATTTCRLRNVRDLARLGRVTLTGSPDDFAIFDAVFDSIFGEATFDGKVDDPEDQQAPRSAASNQETLLQMVEGDAAGSAAADDHLRNRKSFERLGGDDRDALARLKRRLDAMPSVRSRNLVPHARGARIDLAATARAARRTFGETLRLMQKTTPHKPRRLLLLIDVSGSMKAQSEIYLRFAHLVSHRLPKVETFCFGTRLSRVTRTLKHRDPATALERLADTVFDFDGGTLIGASLEEFLGVSRHAALVRGAVTIVFSDGLERGDPQPMIHAVERLSRLSHRLVWATPLAADARYRPSTRGMAGIMPFIDALADGSSLPALERLVANLDAVERMGRGQAAQRFAERRTAA